MSHTHAQYQNSIKFLYCCVFNLHSIVYLLVLIAHIQWESLQLRGQSSCSAQAHLYARRSCSKRWDEIVRNREKKRTRMNEANKPQPEKKRAMKAKQNQYISIQCGGACARTILRCSRFAKTQKEWAVSFIAFSAMHRDLLKWYIDAWCVRWNKAQSKHMETLSMAMTANVSLMNDRMRTKPSRHLTENS